MLNDGHHKIIKMHENAWTLSYLFPDVYGGAKIPDEHQLPSNTTTLTMDRTVKSYEGHYIGVFSPVIETCASYFDESTRGEMPTGNLNDYIVYADNNGGGLNVDTDSTLNSLSTWNYKQGPTLNRLSAYRKLRVVGACMEIMVRDRATDYAGIIETCGGYEVIGNGFKNDSVRLDKLQNHIGYRNYKTNEHVIIKYKYTNEKYTKYGPYEPFTTVPFYIVKISGMSPGASVNIKTTIHIEGVLMPSLVHFATKDLIAQSPLAHQRKKMDDRGDISTTKEEAFVIHDEHTSDLLGTGGYESYVPVVSAEKKKQKIRVSEVLTKRESPEYINLDAPIPVPETIAPGKIIIDGLNLIGGVFAGMNPTDYVKIVTSHKQTQINSITNGEDVWNTDKFALPPSDPLVLKPQPNKQRNAGQSTIAITNGEIPQVKVETGDNMSQKKMINESSAPSRENVESGTKALSPDQFVEAFRVKFPLSDEEANALKRQSMENLYTLFELHRKNPKRVEAWFSNERRQKKIKPSNKYEVTVGDDL